MCYNLRGLLSQSPQTGQFNSYIEVKDVRVIIIRKVSIPSNGSIQFLLALRSGFLKKMKVSIPSNGSIQFLRKGN